LSYKKFFPTKFRTISIRRGLTLIEIVVVVSILGIILTISISSLKNFIRPSAVDVADKLKATLIYCHNTAIIHNQAVILQLDIENNKYIAHRIVRSETGISEKKIIEINLSSSGRLIDVVDLRGIKYDTGIVKIPFTYNGVSEDFSIHLGDEVKIKKSVLNYRYNGKVIIKEGEFSRKARGGEFNNRNQEDESSL
jgi:general secretion pathway protein H